MIRSIVLAAGKGTRMRSDKPKVLHKLMNKSMLEIVLDELTLANIEEHYLVLGYKKNEIIDHLAQEYKYESVVQDEQLGTAHAVMQTQKLLKDKNGLTIITCGDTPLLNADIFNNLIQEHQKNKNDLTILTAKINEPFGYGRIVKNSSGIAGIVEEKDANEIEKEINEINTGVFCVDNKYLFKHISDILNNNNQKEYYLTDIVKIFVEKKLNVGSHCICDKESILGVNDVDALSLARKIYKKRINKFHLQNGVDIIDINNTYIEKNVKIEKNTIIYPGVSISGETRIGENNIILENTKINNSIIGNNNNIGPMAHMRDECSVGNNNRIGNFVELKSVLLSNNVKAAHLTYLGDCEIDENVNIGCGVITANYDGSNKHKTKIGKNCFIGSNTNLIAPCSIGDGTLVAAGTTVGGIIESSKFVIGRTKTQIKENRSSL